MNKYKKSHYRNREIMTIADITEKQRWKSIIDRCTNPNNKFYMDYGGRGIKVCDRWLNSYDDFREDIGPRPSGNHSLDRIDNNGDYEPSNCRWATQTIQLRNTRPQKRNTSGVKGVTFEKSRRKWKAFISTGVDKNPVNLGRFDSLEEAAEARRDAEIKYWGI